MERCEQAKQTCLRNYGVENPSQLEEIKLKKQKTIMKHYGVKNPSALSYSSPRSDAEIELFNFLKSNVDEPVFANDRTQMTPNSRNNWKENHELDIWIPNLKIAIEFNGTYWHNPNIFPQNAYNDNEKKNTMLGKRYNSCTSARIKLERK